MNMSLKKKLVLNRETVRVLTPNELGQVAGGSDNSPTASKGPSCPDVNSCACLTTGGSLGPSKRPVEPAFEMP
jgi:hypothetical protein